MTVGFVMKQFVEISRLGFKQVDLFTMHMVQDKSRIAVGKKMLKWVDIRKGQETTRYSSSGGYLPSREAGR